jgi:phytoene dehydrogenase-like protein
MNSSEPVIVIGAGLAGLRCAQVLRENGFRVVVLEKSDYVGGRLRSYSVDGYRIDEGFQLVNPSYPELRATGVLQHLDLRPFPAAIDLLNNAHWSRLADPRQEPLAAFWALRHLGISQSQKIARLLLRSRLRSARSIAQESDVATREGLRQAGLSQEAIDNVFQPFLRGTLLEDNLDSSWNYVQILLKSFARGRPSTHPNGIVAVADAVAQGTTVQLGTEALHERSDLLHLVTVLLISGDKFGFASNHLTTPQVLRSPSQCFTDSFGSRESHSLQCL